MVASLKSLLIPVAATPQVDTSWLDSIGKSVGDGLDQASQNKSFNRLAEQIGGAPVAQPQGGFLSRLIGGGQQSAAPQAAAIPAPGAQSKMAATAPAPSAIKDLITQNVPPEMQQYAMNLIGKESSFNPSAVSPTGAKGLAQFTKGTGARYGLIGEQGDLRADPVANIKALVALTNDNRNVLTQALGRVPTDGELALAHQQGAQGAIDLLSGKSVSAQNLAVNGVAPGTDPRAAASKIMAYYGGSGGDTPAAQAIQQQAPIASPQTSDIGVPFAGQPLTEDQRAARDVARAPLMAQIGDSAAQPDYRDRAITTAYQQPNAQPETAQPPIRNGNAPMPDAATQAPQQVAQDGPRTLAPGVTPIPRGGASIPLLQSMLRDPNLRQAGLQLWQQNATGKTSDGWDFVTLPDGTFARANKQTGEVQSVGQFQKPSAPVSVGEGSSLVDPQTGKVVYQGAAKTPQSYQEFQLAQQNGFTGSYADWEKVKQPGVTVNNVPGENSTAKSAGEGLGKIFSTIFDGGQAAKQDKAQIGMLRSSLAQSPTGVLGALASTASDYGINVGPNADQVQVAKAVIAKMVPAQRVPGSGTTSDRDLAQFQAALPRLSGTTAGNATILDTLDALADFKSAQSDIVTRFYAGELDQKGAVKELQNLPDPYSAYKKFVGSGEQPAAATTIKPAPSVGTVEQGYRFKGGDPKLQENWEPAR